MFLRPSFLKANTITPATAPRVRNAMALSLVKITGMRPVRELKITPVRSLTRLPKLKASIK